MKNVLEQHHMHIIVCRTYTEPASTQTILTLSKAIVAVITVSLLASRSSALSVICCDVSD
jgi:hypothetical protein